MTAPTAGSEARLKTGAACEFAGARAGGYWGGASKATGRETPESISPQPARASQERFVFQRAFRHKDAVETLEQIKARLQFALPGADLQIVPNDSPSGQLSLSVSPANALVVAQFLRHDPELRLDHASSVTGVDWPERVEKIKTKVKKVVEGVEKEVEETTERKSGGYLEAVYHLFSMEKKHGPVILRQRTVNRREEVRVTSLTPVWRGCEFQEREGFDLYGIVFEGHPDLRRILMWDGFKDHPMRKDYVGPDDYEYEPTPHDEVLEQAKAHRART